MPTIYVSPQGDDKWSGSEKRPLATLPAAVAAVRALKKKTPGKPITVCLRHGTYFLEKPLVFGPTDSGSPEAPVTYAAHPGEPVVISGGVAIESWSEGKLNGKKALAADLPAVRAGRWCFRQLFTEDRRLPRTRLPEEGFYRIAGLPDVTAKTPWNEGQGRFICNPGEVRSWENPADVEVCALHLWTDSRLPIASFDEATGMVSLGKQSVFRLTEDPQGPGCRYFVENVKEAAVRAGQWYLDRAAGVLLFLPRRGETAEGLRLIAPRLTRLIELRGTAARAVEHLRFEGLCFSHTEWDLPKDEAGSPQAAVSVPGAIYAENARACCFDGCEVSRIGNYAFEFGPGCIGNSVRACRLHDLGAGGVKLGEGSSFTTVEDCEISDGGRIFHSAVGVLIGRSNDNQVVHNAIHHLYYTGVSVGWSWGYAPSSAARNVVDQNHIHHIGQGMLSDMGAVYTLGDSPGTRVCHNVIHDVDSFGYGGWGLYTDEGSTGILMQSNVVYRTKCGGFHQHYGKENVIQNNIFAFARENQINRTRNEEHITLYFQRNIVVIESGSFLGGNWEGGQFSFGQNLYHDTRGPVRSMGPVNVKQWRKDGQDLCSLFGDPLFADPARGDFTLKPGSPAADIGFQPIDVSQVGPRREPGRVVG